MHKAGKLQAYTLGLLLLGCSDVPTDPITPTDIPLSTPTEHPGETPTATHLATDTPTHTATQTHTVSPSSTPTQTAGMTATELSTPTLDGSESPGITPSPSATPSASPSGAESPTTTAAHSPTLVPETPSPTAATSTPNPATPTATSPVDEDGDGYGAEVDCNDGDAEIYPGAQEYCDGVDNDCNDVIDDEGQAEGESTFYLDADEDGYGDASQTQNACSAPIGYVDNDLDCDDDNALLNPETLWYADGDGDGFGNPDAEAISCIAPENHVSNAQDCDDDNANLNPQTLWYTDGDADGYGNPDASTQSCLQPANTADNGDDCDDEDATLHPQTPWYADGDGDGYGNPDAETLSCIAPENHVSNNQDCDDDNANLNPQTQWYADGDGDGYGDPQALTQACMAPENHVENDDDCDDSDATLHPQTLWFIDYDQDNYGVDTYTLTQCEAPNGYVQDEGDCNDLDANYYPGAPEEDCTDPNDYNCDNQVGFNNEDGDAFAACEDCNDSDPAIHPDAPEICNGIDDNCDNLVDDEADDIEGQNTFYLDQDGDGYGDSSHSALACLAPENYVDNADDCDDNDPALHPETIWYLDFDADGYGSPDPRFTRVQCEAPSGYVLTGDDCDDGRASDNPGAHEYCDERDNDCDESVDENPAEDAPLWYADGDSDGFGDPETSQRACNAPPGYLSDNNDCDDANQAIHPDATETCNGLDDNCDDIGDEGILGDEPLCSATDCLEIAETRDNLEDGIYWLKPEGVDSAFEAYCDMTVDGGGWTLVASHRTGDYFANITCHTACDTSPATTCDESPFTTATTIGSLSHVDQSDFKSLAYSTIAFNEFLFKDSNAQYAHYDISDETQSSVLAWFPAGQRFHAPENTEFQSAYSYAVAGTNIDNTLNKCDSLTVAFNVEDSDSSITGSCHSSVKGPTWPTYNNNRCFWDDGGIAWRSGLFYAGNGGGTRMWLVR